MMRYSRDLRPRLSRACEHGSLLPGRWCGLRRHLRIRRRGGRQSTNIAIGVSRLGLRSVPLTAVGDDAVGGFVLRYLRDDGVVTDFIPTIEGKLISLPIIGVQPPNNFPLSFYRDDPADIYLTRAHVDTVPFERVTALQVSGNAFSRGSCVDAATYALEVAATHGVTTFMDLDLRPSEWNTASDFGDSIRNVIPHIDVVIGTEEEFYAAFMPTPQRTMSGEGVPEGEQADLDDVISRSRTFASQAFVIKRGRYGARVNSAEGPLDVSGFTIDVLNTVGAGDAFASGLIRSGIGGLGWQTSVKFANACGAITVARPGCSTAFPTDTEVDGFIAERTNR
jgi:5-dehydro-2-deoxygluconokinase